MDPLKHLKQRFEIRGDNTGIYGWALIYLRFVQWTEIEGIAKPLTLLLECQWKHD